MTDQMIAAIALAERTSKPNPNDSAVYHIARTALLAEEIELRRHIEQVAAQRRALPPGGKVSQEYIFTDEAGKIVTLSDMFGDSNTLVTYTWMYGPQRKRPCPLCTSLLSALDGEANDIAQRVPLAIIGKSPIERQLAFKMERGWRGLKFYSTNGNDFTRNYRGEGPDGEDWAAFNVFARDADGTIRLFWAGEMGDGTQDPGQDPRGAPDIMPIWNILDMTPEGRGKDWYPKLEYSGSASSITGVAKAIYDAYTAKDRAAAERLLADDFRFTSPLANALDHDSYFAICWPNSASTEGFNIVNMAEHGEQVFVTYEGQRKQMRFRNTEILTLRNGKIAEVEVYFG